MIQNHINPNDESPNNNYKRVIDVLIREVERLKKEINDIRTDKIIKDLQIPEEELKNVGLIKKVHRLNTGNGWRPLFESEILEAQSHTETAINAAKYLGISYKTYKKWCKVYNLWKTNPWVRGAKKKYWDSNKGKYPLNQILEGKFPNYPIYRLKNLLIRSCVKEAKCEICDFKEKRFTDDKIPLLVNFKDGDEKNYKLENLQILCYNHYFLMGRGFIRRGKVEFNFLDPDRIQGYSRKIDIRF